MEPRNGDVIDCSSSARTRESQGRLAKPRGQPASTEARARSGGLTPTTHGGMEAPVAAEQGRAQVCPAPAQPARKPAGRMGPSMAAPGRPPTSGGARGQQDAYACASARPSRKRPRPEARGAAAGAAVASTGSRGLRRPPAPAPASGWPAGSASAILKRLLKLGLRLLPLLLGSGDLLLVGATATPTGGNGSPQGAKAAGLPPAVGNAKVALNAAARTLASSASGPGAGTGAKGPKVMPPRPPPPLSTHHHPQGQRLLDDHSLVKLLFLIIGLFWILVVVGLLYWAPVVSFLNLMVLSVVILFIKSEGSSWLHHAQEHENRFWTIVAGVGAAVLVFSPDSPLAIGRWSSTLGCIITGAVAFAVHSYDRHLHRVNISRKPQFVRRTRRTTTAGGGSTGSGADRVSSLNTSGTSSLGASGPHPVPLHLRGGSTNSLPLPNQPLSPPSTPPTSQRGGHGLSTSLPGSSSQRPRVASTFAGTGRAEGAEGDETTRTQRALSFSGPGAGADPAAVTSPVHRPSLGSSPPAVSSLASSLSSTTGASQKAATAAAIGDSSSKDATGAAAVAAAAAAVNAATMTGSGTSISTSVTGSSASGSGAGSLEGDSTGGGSLPVSPTGVTTTVAAAAATAVAAVVSPATGAPAEAEEGAGAGAAPVPAEAAVAVVAHAPAPTPAPAPSAPSQRLLGLLLESSNVDGEKVLDAVARSAAEEKLEVIEHALKEVDQYLIASTITNYFNVQRVLRLERTIINIFNAARTDELNFLVSHVPLGLLFYKVKDHTITASGARCLNRTDLIEVLAVTRISELGIPERAMVLDALQQMKLTAHRQAEKWVRNIILSTLGDSLSELKTLMDAKGDFQSLHKLIFDDIRSERIRHEILVHIRKQAQVQAAHMKLGTRLARQRRERQPWRKILSDVDDTLVSSGGRFPAGMDRRLPRHAVYPGVLAFYRELDLGVTEGADEWGPDRDQGNLVFLSARPHLYKDVSEKHSYAKFRRLQAERGMHTTPTLLAGSLDSGYNYVMERNIEGLAVKKMENFEQFVSLYPEYSFVFIGDNGQGDLRAAELMVKRARDVPKHPRIDAVYIHRVQPLSRSYGYDEQAFCRWRDMGICFFDNYIEAAMDAAVRRSPPLIRLTGLRRVVEAAVHDFGLVDAWPSERDRELRRVELNRSILRANDLLVKHGLAPVPCIPASHNARFEPGARVMTLYGAGVVRRYRPDDGVYEVVLDWAAAASASAAGGRQVKRLSLNGPSAAATPLAMTPLSVSPPRMEHRARSESLGGPPSPLTLPSPRFVALPSSASTGQGHQQHPQQQPVHPGMAAASAAAQALAAEASLTSPVHRSVSATATCTAPPPTPSSVAGGAGTTPMHVLPPTPSLGSVGGPGGLRSSLGGGPYAFPRGAAASPVVAYLQEAAILQAIVPSSTKAAAPASSASTGLSSYISFFPGASYLTRLRSDRSANRFAPGTAVSTPYGPGVIIQHRPVKAAAAAATAPAAVAGAGAPGATAGAAGAESVPGMPAAGTAAATAAVAAATGALASAPGAAASVAPAPGPVTQPQPAQETCVVQLKWGAKAYLPVGQLSPASASAGGMGAAGLTSPRGGRVPGSVTPGGSLEPSAGLLASMMGLLSLGSGRGKPGAPGAGVAKPASARQEGQRGQLLVVPGMAVTTKMGPAVVKERREADGVTVLSLGSGAGAPGKAPVATVYVPAAGLTDFLTPPGGRNSTAAATGPRGTPNSRRKSLSPPSAGAAGGAGGSLLGFFKATVVPSAASGVTDSVPLATVVIKEEPPSSPLAPLPPSQQRSRANSVDSEVSIASSISTTSTGLRGWFARATATTSSTSSLGVGERGRLGPGGRRRLAVGDRVSSKMGEAVVLRVREFDQTVEVAFTRWRGRGYLRVEEVQPELR